MTEIPLTPLIPEATDIQMWLGGVRHIRYVPPEALATVKHNQTTYHLTEFALHGTDMTEVRHQVQQLYEKVVQQLPLGEAHVAYVSARQEELDEVPSDDGKTYKMGVFGLLVVPGKEST